MSDTYGEWFLQVLGVWNEGKYLDKLEQKFKVTLYPSDTETREDILNALRAWEQHPSQSVSMADIYARKIYEAVIEKAVNELDAKEDDFEYWCDGLYGTDIKCKGEYVTDWEDIESMYK